MLLNMCHIIFRFYVLLNYVFHIYPINIFGDRLIALKAAVKNEVRPMSPSQTTPFAVLLEPISKQ